MKNGMKERNISADVLKGIAVVFMIQVHVVEQLLQPELANSAIGKFLLFLGGPPAAPVFMSVMGYFAWKSKRDLIYQLNRGTQLIIGGILLNIGLNFSLLYHYFIGDVAIDPYRYIFGADILPLAGLSIIIIALIKWKYKKNLLLLFFLLSAPLLSEFNFYTLEINQSFKYFISFFYGISDWSYFPLIPWVSYPLIGAFFSELESVDYIISYINKNKIALVVTWLLFMLFTYEYYIGVSSNLNEYYHHGIYFFLWVIVFLIGYVFIVNIICNYFNGSLIIKLLKYYGEEVTSVYVIQWLIIGNSAYFLHKNLNSIESIVAFISITILTTVLTYLWSNKIKIFLSEKTSIKEN